MTSEYELGSATEGCHKEASACGVLRLFLPHRYRGPIEEVPGRLAHVQERLSRRFAPDTVDEARVRLQRYLFLPVRVVQVRQIQLEAAETGTQSPLTSALVWRTAGAFYSGSC